MKIFGITLLLLLGICSGIQVQAQPGRLQDRMDKIETLKIGYFTEKMALTTEEAQVFWPVYNAYQADRESLKRELNQFQRRIRQQGQVMSDSQLEESLDQFLEFKQKEVDLAIEYKGKLKAVLPVRKVVAFFRAEQEFNRTLVKKYRDQLEQRMNRDR